MVQTDWQVNGQKGADLKKDLVQVHNNALNKLELTGLLLQQSYSYTLKRNRHLVWG